MLEYGLGLKRFDLPDFGIDQILRARFQAQINARMPAISIEGSRPHPHISVSSFFDLNIGGGIGIGTTS